jgi:hypothetical protein
MPRKITARDIVLGNKVAIPKTARHLVNVLQKNAPSGPGRMTWRGRVDDYVELNIQGNRVRSREREGSQTLNEQVSFSNPLPRADVAISVRKRDGRGRVSVVQQPNQSNNYTAIIKIDDEKGGADDYEIEMEWR